MFDVRCSMFDEKLRAIATLGLVSFFAFSSNIERRTPNSPGKQEPIQALDES